MFIFKNLPETLQGNNLFTLYEKAFTGAMRMHNSLSLHMRSNHSRVLLDAILPVLH